jgi:glycosyltransferase involved in cell wall biosynthesis
MVGWIPGALSAGTSLIEGWRPDVVYVSGPPFSGFLIAKRLAQMASCPWIADYRDAWTSGGYYAQSRVRRTLDRAIEKRVVRTSAAVVTVSDPLATEISDVLGVPVESIPNGFDGVTLPSARDRIPLSGATLNLLYVGNNLYEGRRSPAPLLLGARRLGLSAEDVKFHFLGTDPHLVEQVAKATSSSDLVQVWPGTAHEESVAMQSRADVLMLLLWNSPLEAGTYSGKLFEYLAVGRPIVMSGYPHGVAAQLIQSRSLGAIVNTPSDAEIWLRDALRSKGGKSLLNADLPAENRRGLSREERNAEMIALLRSVVDGRG